MSKKIKITQVRSAIGRLENQKKTMKALGCKMNKSRIHDDTPVIRGMINTVKHLVKIEEV
ncbi:50S ribosomal protein L30p (L7e) [Chitinispirillum alkaliphilum]|nr:50S ribosomal protein L30p (L7e) [Chitinispirillum alkaliphilum]